MFLKHLKELIYSVIAFVLFLIIIKNFYMHKELMITLFVVSYGISFALLRKFYNIVNLKSLLSSSFLLGFLLSPYYALYLLTDVLMNNLFLCIKKKLNC